MVDRPLQIVNTLNTGKRGLAIKNKRRHPADAERFRLSLISQNIAFIFAILERRAKSLAIQPQLDRLINENVHVSDVLAPLEEGTEDSLVILIEVPLAASPMSSLMCTSRARLHRRELHRYTQPLSQWID
jgi:hypothetical protein